VGGARTAAELRVLPNPPLNQRHAMLAVPTLPLKACDALRQLEDITWQELEAGCNCKNRLDEESVTSYHLMRLATAVPSIKLEKHTRRREARTGADFEWWIGRPGAYLGLRIQAKMLNPSSAKYGALLKSGSLPLKQVDTLIKDAEGTRKCYPIYCFYNYWFQAPHRRPKWPCPRPSQSPSSVGWTIASAYALRDRLRSVGSTKLWDLSDLMYPISCILCCDCSLAGERRQGQSLASAVAGRIHARWADWSAPSVAESAPPYVERLAQSEELSVGWDFPLTSGRPDRLSIPDDLARVLLLRDIGAAA
jgi:hypothetical protein